MLPVGILFWLHCAALAITPGLHMGSEVGRLRKAGELKSVAWEGKSRQVKARITNEGTDALHFAWIDFKGVERDPDVIEPGKAANTKTFPGHTFIFRDARTHQEKFALHFGNYETALVLVDFNSATKACIASHDYSPYKQRVAEADKLLFGSDLRRFEKDQDLDQALSEYNLLARQGNSFAIHRIAEVYLSMEDLPFSKRVARAVPNLEESAVNQISESWLLLAFLRMAKLYPLQDDSPQTLETSLNEARFLANCANQAKIPRAQLLYGYGLSEGLFGDPTRDEPGVCALSWKVYEEFVNMHKPTIEAEHPHRAALPKHLSALGNDSTIEDENWHELSALAQVSGESHAVANYKLGVAHMFGEGMPQDYKKAVDHFKNAAEKDHPMACKYFAYLHEKGLGVEEDFATSFKFYQKAADLGEKSAYAKLAHLYQHGLGVERSLEKAVEHSQTAADEGYAEGFFQLGRYHRKGEGGFEKDEAKSLELWKKAAKLGSVDAQYELSTLLKNQEADNPAQKVKNCNDALFWMKRAAEQHPDVSLDLEVATRHWQREDVAQALIAFWKMSLYGYSSAQLNLGWILEQRNPLRQDACDSCKASDAFDFYHLAARQNDGEASRAVGDYFYYGKPPVDSTNFEEAVKFYEQAAEQGSAIAAFDLGFMLEHGLGVPSDFKRAMFMYKKAADGQSEVRWAALISLRIIQIRMFVPFHFNFFGALQSNFPTLLKNVQSQRAVSSFGSFGNVDLSLLSDPNVWFEVLSSLVLAIILTWVIPDVASKEGEELFQPDKKQDAPETMRRANSAHELVLKKQTSSHSQRVRSPQSASPGTASANADLLRKKFDAVTPDADYVDSPRAFEGFDDNDGGSSGNSSPAPAAGGPPPRTRRLSTRRPSTRRTQSGPGQPVSPLMATLKQRRSRSGAHFKDSKLL